MNYVPEIRNGCNVWEQAFCHYCQDPLVFDRWGYMQANYHKPLVDLDLS